MTKGLEFYRHHEILEVLKNSHQTQIFTQRFNTLFNVLNNENTEDGRYNNKQ